MLLWRVPAARIRASPVLFLRGNRTARYSRLPNPVCFEPPRLRVRQCTEGDELDDVTNAGSPGPSEGNVLELDGLVFSWSKLGYLYSSDVFVMIIHLCM